MERLALRGDVLGENMDVINTAVAPLVGVVRSREQEMSGVVDGWQGVVLCCAGGGEDQLEGTPLVLWFNRACDGEVGAHEHLKLLPLGLGDPVSGGGGGDVWLGQKTCSKTRRWRLVE